MPTQNILSEVFYRSYGPEAHTMAQDSGCSIYKMENETGEGIMTRYPDLPEIELLYNDIHMTVVHAEQNKLPYENVMEINHCREGRFECEFSDGTVAETGTPEELMKQNGAFARMVRLQTESRDWVLT